MTCSSATPTFVAALLAAAVACSACGSDTVCAIELSEEIRPLRACEEGDECVEVPFCSCTTVVNAEYEDDFVDLLRFAQCGGNACPVPSCRTITNIRCETVSASSIPSLHPFDRAPHPETSHQVLAGPSAPDAPPERPFLWASAWDSRHHGSGAWPHEGPTLQTTAPIPRASDDAAHAHVCILGDLAWSVAGMWRRRRQSR